MEATNSKTEATIFKREATHSKLEATLCEMEATCDKTEAPVFAPVERPVDAVARWLAGQAWRARAPSRARCGRPCPRPANTWRVRPAASFPL